MGLTQVFLGVFQVLIDEGAWLEILHRLVLSLPAMHNTADALVVSSCLRALCMAFGHTKEAEMVLSGQQFARPTQQAMLIENIMRQLYGSEITKGCDGNEDAKLIVEHFVALLLMEPAISSQHSSGPVHVHYDHEEHEPQQQPAVVYHVVNFWDLLPYLTQIPHTFISHGDARSGQRNVLMDKLVTLASQVRDDSINK